MPEYIAKERTLEIVKRTSGDYAQAFAEISRLPATDVAPVAHATTTDAGWDEIYCQWKTCNHCQSDNVSTAIYCNWCGARMDGGESNG